VWDGCAALVRGETTYERITRSAGPLAATLRPLAHLGRRVSTARHEAR